MARSAYESTSRRARRAIGMIHNEQRNALHLGRIRESKHGFALAVRPEALECPLFRGDFAFGVEHGEGAFVPLRLRVGAPLIFGHDLARVVGCGKWRTRRNQERVDEKYRGEQAMHLRAIMDTCSRRVKSAPHHRRVAT